MPLCDGCGAQVDEAHIRSRIERLEQATRFRPIHIQVLLLAAAPPSQPEDDFYRAATAANRSFASQTFFDELTKSIGRKSQRHRSRRSHALGISARRLLSRLRRRMSYPIAGAARRSRHQARPQSPAAREHFLQTKIRRANIPRTAAADSAARKQFLGRSRDPARRQTLRRSHRKQPAASRRIRRRASRSLNQSPRPSQLTQPQLHAAAPAEFARMERCTAYSARKVPQISKNIIQRFARFEQPAQRPHRPTHWSAAIFSRWHLTSRAQSRW